MPAQKRRILGWMSSVKSFSDRHFGRRGKRGRGQERGREFNRSECARETNPELVTERSNEQFVRLKRALERAGIQFARSRGSIEPSKKPIVRLKHSIDHSGEAMQRAKESNEHSKESIKRSTTLVSTSVIALIALINQIHVRIDDFAFYLLAHVHRRRRELLSKVVDES